MTAATAALAEGRIVELRACRARLQNELAMVELQIAEEQLAAAEGGDRR